MFSVSVLKSPRLTASLVMGVFTKAIKDLEEVITLHTEHSAKQNEVAAAALKAAEASNLEVATAQQHIAGLNNLLAGNVAPPAAVVPQVPGDLL